MHSLELIRLGTTTFPAHYCMSRRVSRSGEICKAGEVEADYFNGEIVRLGRQHNVPTPYNSLLLELIKEMAAARELPGKYTIEQLQTRLHS